MRLHETIWLALLATAISAIDEQQSGLWSWSSNSEQTNNKQNYAIESNIPTGNDGVNVNFNQTADVVLNVDDVIETILSSNRQGRNLDGFDEVYSDPTVQDALQKGDDTQARNLIKEKLCSLGLMQCDNAESIEGKRPFLPPHGLIYAQPPNSPYHGPPRPPGPGKIIYGPARPMPPGLINKFGPPRKVGYAPGGPILTGPSFISGPPPNFQGPIYHSKPPGPILDSSSPYKFDTISEHLLTHEDHHEIGFSDLSNLNHAAPKPTIVVNAHGGAASNGQGSTQANSVNIHHHYHHVDGTGAKSPPVIVNNPVPVPVVGNNLVSGEYSALEHHHEGVTGGAGGSGIVGFNPLTSGYDFKQTGSLTGGSFNSINPSLGLGPVNGIASNGVYGAGAKPVFESVNNYDHSASGSYSGLGTLNAGAGLNGAHSGFGGGGAVNSYGQSVSGLYNSNTGSFHSLNPGYHKKALNANSGVNALNAGYAGQYGNQYNAGENYQGLESSRQDNFDCVCVPFDQCPARDVYGRKGDLILPLDPRNLGSDIEAISDDDKSNSTQLSDKQNENKGETVSIEQTKEELKSISKRDVSEKKSDDIQKADGEAVSFIYKL